MFCNVGTVIGNDQCVSVSDNYGGNVCVQQQPGKSECQYVLCELSMVDGCDDTIDHGQYGGNLHADGNQCEWLYRYCQHNIAGWFGDSAGIVVIGCDGILQRRFGNP